MIDWQHRARILADEIEASGVLHDPAWRAALEAVPRHVFVPRFYEQRPDTSWQESTADTPGWLDAVYANKPLITDLAETANGGRVTVSSSSKPGLMIRMLEHLDVRDGDRVLEIGTGTGYNAGLLSHRLGDSRVVSIDIGAELVRAARRRLADLGHAPTLIAGDGAQGVPGCAPFDRIIATCAVPSIPAAWHDQLRDGGLLLVDFKRSTDAGNLVLLQRIGKRLEGRFLWQWAGFMSIRTADAAPATASTGTAGADEPVVEPGGGSAGHRSSTRLSPYPWASLVPWFLAQAGYPSHVIFGLRGITENGPTWTSLTTGDGSWAWVRLQPQDDGARETWQGGPLRLWDVFEAAQQEWERLGCPGWGHFGLTVLPNGEHTVWLESPESESRWHLPR